MVVNVLRRFFGRGLHGFNGFQSAKSASKKLEGVLDRELHDPRPGVVQKLAEGSSVLLTSGDGARVIRAIGQKVGAVRNIERFRAKIDALPFTNTKRFSEREVHIEIAGTYERIWAHIAPDCIRHRRGKRSPVQPAVYGFFLAIGIRKDLRSAVSSHTVEVRVDSRGGAEGNPGVRAADHCKLPVARDASHQRLRECRSLNHGRKIEDVPEISPRTTSTVGPSIVGIRIRTRQQRGAEIGNAVRPRVIGLNCEVIRQAVLKRKQQPAVGRGSPVVQIHNRVVVGTLGWVEQRQQAAWLRIRCGGTWARRCESVLSSVAISWNVLRRIQSLRTPEVNRAASEITCLCQPVGSNLLFDTEIPLVQIWRMIAQRNADVWRLCRKHGILAERVREGISAGKTLPGIRKTARRT